MAEVMSNVKAIKTFFEEGPSGRKVEMAELKALTDQEREELGAMAKAALSS